MDSGQQGQLTKQTGANISLSMGEYGEPLVTELQPRFYQQTYRGVTFTTQFPAAAAAAASATVLGAFALFNPLGTGKNLVMLDSTIALVSFTPATTPLQLSLVPFTQVPTSVGAGPVAVNTFIGGPLNAASVSKTYVSGTTVAASTTAIKLLGNFYIDLAAGDVIGSLVYNFDGKLIIAPGSGISVVAIATVPTNSIAVDFTWMEVAI
jgi:hypothetical protein